MKYWQIAAGGQGRDYSKDFLRYGMAFVGGRQQTEYMQSVQEGDCMLLKDGLSKIIAAGHVVKRKGRSSGHAREDMDRTKQWLLHYDGWELPAYCYVDWCQPLRPESTSGLVQAAIRRVHKSHLQRLATTIIMGRGPPEPLEDEPGAVDDLKQETLPALVHDRSSAAAMDIARYLPKLKQLVSTYDEQWDEVREHETRTFLVIPFLLALGWKEEQIKIELPVKWQGGKGRADVVCFPAPYRSRGQVPTLVIETKGYSLGLSNAGRQAADYARSLNCDWAIASNGYSYKIYRRINKGDLLSEKYIPVSYLNLIRPTARYPLDPVNIAGAAEALAHLMPP